MRDYRNDYKYKYIDKLTLDELRFIVRQFADWSDNEGCPAIQYNDFSCEDCKICSNIADGECDSTNEVNNMCWLQYFAWCYRNNRNPYNGKENQ